MENRIIEVCYCRAPGPADPKSDVERPFGCESDPIFGIDISGLATAPDQLPGGTLSRSHYRLSEIATNGHLDFMLAFSVEKSSRRRPDQ